MDNLILNQLYDDLSISKITNFDNIYWKAWFFLVPMTYFALVIIFRQLDVLPQPTRDGSRSSDMMAFLVVAGGCVTYLAAAGFILFYSLFEVNDYNKLEANHFYGRSEFLENHLIYPMLAYQGWNVVLCLFVKDLRKPEMIGHHIVTGTLGLMGLHPFLHYRGLFFFGVAEVTNVPLTILDMFKYITVLKEKYPMGYSLTQVTFAASFIILRLIAWPI